MKQTVLRASCTAAIAFAASSVFGQSPSAPRDSAGIRIYDYRGATIPTAFVVADTPVARFSSTPGDPMAPRFATTITRLRNGNIAFGTSSVSSRSPGPIPQVNPGSTPPDRIVVPNSVFQRDASWTTTIDIRVFDSTGTFVRRVGQFGAGPAQFPAGPNVVVEAPDRRLLVGSTLPGFRVISNDTVISSVPASVAFGKLIGVFSDGSTLVSRLGTIWPSHPAEIDSVFQLKNESTGYVRLSSDGKTTTQLPVTTRAIFWENTPGNAASITNMPWPYWTSDAATVGADVIWLFNPYKWELQSADKNGVIKSIVRAPLPFRATEARLGGRFPRTTSYNVETFADNAGRLWMDSGNNNPPAATDTTRRDWIVFAPSGEMLGRVVMPNGFRPMTASDNLIIGPWRPRLNVSPLPASFRFK